MRLSSLGPITYLITRGDLTAANFSENSGKTAEIIRVAVECGVTLVQIREKALPVRLLAKFTGEIATITSRSETKLLVNDRADVAAAAGGDGVHLTMRSLPVSTVRRDFGSEFLIGVSTHTIEDVVEASTNGADFAVFGPVFESPGKMDMCGIGGLHGVCERVRPFPVLGLGGIDASNFAEVLSTGAAGFAAIRSMNDVGFLRKVVSIQHSG